MAGGSPDKGPVIEGCPSGMGAAGAAGAAAGSAGLASAGGVCAVQTEANARQSTNTLIPCKKRPNMFHLSFFHADDKRKKKRPEAPTMDVQLDVVV
jgi:hypothetical protein